MGRKKPDYAVGYGKPPVETQFKKGQSGNPNGRPKKPTQAQRAILKQINTKVTVSEKGRSRRAPFTEVVVSQMMKDAARGDSRARRDYFRLLKDLEGIEEEPEKPKPKPRVNELAANLSYELESGVAAHLNALMFDLRRLGVVVQRDGVTVIADWVAAAAELEPSVDVGQAAVAGAYPPAVDIMAGKTNPYQYIQNRMQLMSLMIKAREKAGTMTPEFIELKERMQNWEAWRRNNQSTWDEAARYEAERAAAEALKSDRKGAGGPDPERRPLLTTADVRDRINEIRARIAVEQSGGVPETSLPDSESS